MYQYGQKAFEDNIDHFQNFQNILTHFSSVLRAFAKIKQL